MSRMKHCLLQLTFPRLAGKYRWREFPAVITGNYRPGKYSKFWQSGKYWEIWNFRAVWAKICCNISINLSWQHTFLIAYVHIMQIKYKFHDWSMLQDTADGFWQTLKSFLIICQVVFQHYISKHKIFRYLITFITYTKVLTRQSCSFTEIPLLKIHSFLQCRLLCT